MYEATLELFKHGIISEAAAWRSLEAAKKEGAKHDSQIEALVDMNAYGTDSSESTITSHTPKAQHPDLKPSPSE